MAVAAGVPANHAQVFVGEVVANFASFNLPAHFYNGSAKLINGVNFTADQVQNQPQCCLFADTWQAGKRIYGVFK
jgi:hypothetical protein